MAYNLSMILNEHQPFMDMFLKNNQLILYSAALIALFILLVAVFWIRAQIKKRQSALATTALMKKHMGQQSATTGGMQFELRASEYGVEETVQEIKKNLNRLTMNKKQIIELVDELKEKITQKELTPAEIKLFIEEIKQKNIEIGAKTNQFCAVQNIERFEEALPKITPATRIMHAKDKSVKQQGDVNLLMKSAELDKKQFVALLVLVRELPKEMQSFLAFIETQLKAIERKFEGNFTAKLKGTVEKVLAEKIKPEKGMLNKEMKTLHHLTSSAEKVNPDKLNKELKTLHKNLTAEHEVLAEKHPGRKMK